MCIATTITLLVVNEKKIEKSIVVNYLIIIGYNALLFLINIHSPTHITNTFFFFLIN